MNKNRKQRLLAALLLTVTAIIAALFSSCSGNNGQSAIIDPEVFRTGVGKNGRYLVSVSIKEPETPLTPYAGIPAYNEEYLAGHGIYDNDVRYNSGSYYRVIIYADREKLEELAKDPATVWIRHDLTERETVWYCQSGENHVDV